MCLWYFEKAGQTHGPVSRETLLELLGVGELYHYSLVWSAPMSHWCRIDETELHSPAPDASRAIPFEALPYRPQSEIINAAVMRIPLFRRGYFEPRQSSAKCAAGPLTNPYAGISMALAILGLFGGAAAGALGVLAWPLLSIMLELGALGIALTALTRAEDVAYWESKQRYFGPSRAEKGLARAALTVASLSIPALLALSTVVYLLGW